MRKTIYLLATLFAVISLRAQQVSPEEALLMAQYIFPDKQSELRIAHLEKNQDDPLYYIISHETGYAVVAGNKNAVPLLAYSSEGGFNSENVIPPLMMWLNHYEEQLSALYKEDFINPSCQQQWENVLSHLPGSYRSVDEVKPFLTAQWGQGEKYNFYCPRDISATNGRAVTGCVATAMAQLLYYFRFPENGIGSYSYQHDTYGTISADFENTHYNFDGMLDVPAKINPDASLLIHHLGVAVDMVYGANSSGMFNHKAAYALRTHFRFSPETEYLYRDSTTMNWDSVIVSHLNQKIPMYYAGWSLPHTDGHAFICDGYQLDTNDNYYYHFDFGWDGYYNGYFYTENLRPGGNNFNLAQELIVNAVPDEQYNYPNIPTAGSRILTAEAGSFTDGSPSYMNYAANMDYSWIIRPEMTNYESLKFAIKYQLDPTDTIFISCDDPNIADRFITDDSGSLNLTVLGSEIVVRFVTSSEEKHAPGFYCEYISQYDNHCSGMTIYTQPEGEFDDGSGDEDYFNCVRCSYRIICNSADLITLHFDRFDTEENEDIVYIYDYSGSNRNLLATLSGALGDTSCTFTANRLNLVFETSTRNTSSGWHLSYTSANVGITEHASEIEVAIFPNPAGDMIHVSVKNPEGYPLSGGFEVDILDLQGRVLQREHIEDLHILSIPVSELAPGLYLLQIRNRGTVLGSYKWSKLRN